MMMRPLVSGHAAWLRQALHTLQAGERRGRVVAMRSLSSSTVSFSTTHTNNTDWSFSWRSSQAAQALLMATTAAAVVVSTATTTTKSNCEEAPPVAAATATPSADDDNKEDTDTSSTDTPSPDASLQNPFWPSGVDDAQVQALVDDCINDPTINIKAIPDFMERRIYSSTIRLTLNLVYQTLGQLHGTSILAHELRLTRQHDETARQVTLSQLRNDLDEDVLEQVADRLLANRAVNQSMIPDAVERQVYVNCLKIVFRLLDLLSASLAISVCGHDLRIAIEPRKRRELLQDQASKLLDNDNDDIGGQKACTPIDTQLLLQYAQQEAGIDLSTDEQQQQQSSWWYRFWYSQSTLEQEFMVQLHSALYSLILGILDDLLEHTEIMLLSDQVRLDLVPAGVLPKPASVAGTVVTVEAPPKEDDDDGGNGYLPLASFTMGVGVGLTLMVLATSASK